MLETSVGLRTLLVLDPDLSPEGVEFVRDPGPHVDAVICGLAQAEQAARLKLPTFVAVGEESIQPALQAGLTEFVARPVDWPRLLERVQEMLQRRHLHAFQEVSRFLHHAESLLASPAHRELERQIVNAAALATNADGGWLFGVEQGVLTPLEAVGYPLPPVEEVNASKGLLHDAFTSRLEKCVGLAGDEDPKGLTPFERGKSTLLAVPLMNHGRCLGVLELAREAGKPIFRQDQVTATVQLARLAGAVLAAHRHEEHFTSLLLRSLQRMQAGRTDLATSLEKVGHEVREAHAEEGEILELVDSLRALKALGGNHLEFWSQTLKRYLAARS